ncbi:MAG: metal-dependent transcriptional regulator [Candidatus Omnitrophica bacterium]|nr:metal-dependent transcriptional regulator [Candidatus Omnitrophota bacterium]MCA9449202.1 metal-dependent transcriptional regulator [Candidatus Omnitrophota bacterium]
MTNEVWKQFEENGVTHSMGHYLMAIRDLLKARGYARVTDVANHLGVSRSSASTSLASLKKKGLVDEDDNHFLRLPPKGHTIALQIRKNHMILETFFKDVLGVEEEQALIDACKMEHLLSPETGIRLLALVKTILTNEDLKKQAIEGIPCDLCKSPVNCPVCSEEDPCPLHLTEEDLKLRPI